MATKLFVGTLSFTGTPVDFETLFTEAGAVVSVNLSFDKLSGQMRGCGFVEMGSQADAQSAIVRCNGYALQGRALTVNEAKPQVPRGGGGRGGSDSGGANGAGKRASAVGSPVCNQHVRCHDVRTSARK